jgi:hypothetical protein
MTANTVSEVATAARAMPMENHTMLTSIALRRPMWSPIAPLSKAPTMTPTSPKFPLLSGV